MKIANLSCENSKKAESYLIKTRELVAKGNYRLGLKKINKAIKYDPENIGYYSVKLVILEHLKKYKKLVKLFDIFIKFDFDKVSSYYSKSKIMIQKLKKYKAAIEVIDKGLLIDPNNPRLIELKLEALIRMGNIGKARDFFNQVLAQSSNNQEIDNHMYI